MKSIKISVVLFKEIEFKNVFTKSKKITNTQNNHEGEGEIEVSILPELKLFYTKEVINKVSWYWNRNTKANGLDKNLEILWNDSGTLGFDPRHHLYPPPCPPCMPTLWPSYHPLLIIPLSWVVKSDP